nr:Ldh family oxidoreductase [uncultured Cohaesibacter sp.]
MKEKTRIFDPGTLQDFARQAFEAVGMASHLSDRVALILLEGDLMGHDTHGLALLPAYLSSAEAGGMTLQGEPEILNEKPAAALWDGKMLPGPWLISEGFKLAVKQAKIYGTFTLSIKHSHHTAGLISYLKPVTDAGMIAMLSVSDPTEACVAPFGGKAPVLSTNPVAYGIPTEDGAVMLDMSTSQTTNGMVNRRYRQQRYFDHDWLINDNGEPSRDPATRFTTPPGAIMPLGGFSSGHKGTGLGIVVEALTHGLSGNGRALQPKGWENNVFLQVIDPEAFAGQNHFATETGFLGQQIRSCPPVDIARPVRVPGERALTLRAQRLRDGVPLSDDILSGLYPWAEKFNLQLPEAKQSNVG